MFTQYKYSVFNFDSPFYQTGNEVANRPTSGKANKVAKPVKRSTLSFGKFFLRPEIV
ncbi:hypothetical protein OAP63_01600 [Vibrio sp.]|nr:hypothetical protein [Vibrio sp.]